MYNVSDKYKEAMTKHYKTNRVVGKITLSDGSIIDISNSDIMAGTLSIDNACINGQDFQLGCVYLGQLQVTLKNDINRYSLFNSEITFDYYLKLSDGTEEKVPLGIYTISEANRKGQFVSITAYDNMIKLDKTFNMTTSVGSVYDLLKLISIYCGIDLAQTEDEINEMSPKDTEGNLIKLSIPQTNDYKTWRDYASDLCIILGGFGTITRDGEFIVKRFNNTSSINIPDIQIKSKTISDYTVNYTSVIASIKDKTYIGGDLSGQQLTIKNCLWNSGTNTTKQKIIDNISEGLVGVEYTPCEIDYSGDPAFDIGDMVIYNSIDKKSTVKSYVMTNDWTYRGGQKIKAVGSNPKLSNAKSKSEKDISSVSDTLSKESFNILRFQSTTRVDIGSDNKLVCQVNLDVNKNTSSLYVGQINLMVTKPGTFQILYELNGENLTFNPSQIITYCGPHIINLLAVLDDLTPDSTNTLNVYLKSTDGGEGYIEIGNVYTANATSGLDQVTEIRFNGKINISENINLLNKNKKCIKMKDLIKNELISPQPGNGFDENINILTHDKSFIGFSENIDIN